MRISAGVHLLFEVSAEKYPIPATPGCCIETRFLNCFQSHSSVAPADQKSQLSGEEQEKKISTYEEAMAKIKDATGVSDIQEVVQRFLSQGDTHKHLEQLKIDNEKMLARLKEEKVC